MGIKSVFLSAAMAVSVLGVTTQASLAETLADAMAGAYTHSGLLEQNRALLRVADENVAQATASLRPILSWSSELRRTFSDPSSAVNGTSANLGLNLSWTLVDNGSKKLARERLKQTVLATRESLVAVEQNVLLAAVRAFMDVRRDSEIVALRQNNLRVITRELRAAEDRFDVGEVTRTDVALAQARLAGARAELAVAQGNLMASNAAYAAAVGRKPSQLTPPSRLPSVAKTVAAAEAVAVRSHPDMKAAQFQVAAADIGIKEADVSVIPSVDLSAGVSRQNFLSGGTGDRSSGSVSIIAGGPIYSGGAIASASRQAIANRDAARGGLHATRHTIRQSVGFAWAQLLAARAQRVASGQQIKASQVAFEGVREEAKLGSRTTLDVLNAEQELLDARANQITAQSAEFTAAYSLLASMGLLTVDHLNLAVEKYDPEAYYNQVQSAPAALSKRGQQLDKVLRRIGKE
ncbi:TolC family outer membrane protein [Cognatishimia activa]|uniref:TolC family outer membrane protein n=1 Tax=Cognatishimia activa TaxID=1715691 RepID=UPI00222E7AFA|nr:TolC family outer membrane protein [Cognatishimia activa]UZD91478.1 TolC family outer membrane protein [Cognatishimia activa]